MYVLNNKKRILLLLLINMVFYACDDSFLELNPESNANVEDFFKTEEDFQIAINAAYGTLYTIYDPQGPVSYTGEMMSDNATLYVIAGAQTDKQAFNNYQIQASNTMVYSFWQQFYNALYDINLILQKVENSNLDDSFKTNVKAQMSFLRGLYYFNMVRLWGDLPLVKKPLSLEEAYTILRSSKSEIYNFIISDLTYAVDHLSPTSEIIEKGEASREAAETILGHVYLTLGRNDEAIAQFMEVFQSGEFDLLDDYNSLWGPDAKNTKESIFEIQYNSGSISEGTYSKYYQGFFPNVNVLGFSGVGMNQVTDDLYAAYENGDIRRDITIALGYESGNGTFIEQKYPKKWTDEDAPIDGSTILSNNNFLVYRYADLLLMLSEATGDPHYLNMVRERVNLPLWGTSGYPVEDYPTLALAIEHERRVELATEFHRWFDLKRTGKAVPVLTEKGKPITENKLLLPIPTTVIDQNEKITQNEGY